MLLFGHRREADPSGQIHGLPTDVHPLPQGFLPEQVLMRHFCLQQTLPFASCNMSAPPTGSGAGGSTPSYFSSFFSN